MRPAVALVDDLDTRVPVWMALSALYLDNETAGAYAGIVETLAASPYSVDTLRRILVDEIHPALHHNLLQVAGEWTGFDEAWLVQHVQTACARPLWRRRLARLSFGMVRDDWRVLEPMIHAARNSHDA